ncbi:bifunctional DNA-formamidopyrimidine glycosylase/DNA-(apurinic or apyrimidinic site) lyase [Emcibacter sp. SYSU 3D8]|uniref:bifunctional DNA-formamidopyrimidine glycosylase/DNA-(apurinic or apyrimidinic site) lyase n=1 Tax=Emcibacter sp. SYSU 3D8 TaxID=3133969 RepID=UPI0031FF065E
MPELPEVETVCRGLRGAMVGRVLTGVTARRPDLRFPLPPDFSERLQGRRIERIDRRAKYIVVHLDDGQVLIMHLGMSGRMNVWAPQGSSEPPPVAAHDHVIFEVGNGSRVVFHDPRRFGFMALTREEALAAHPYFAHLGPEPLGDGFSADYLSGVLGGKRTPIKAALLDQRVVAGLGNIYVCEALHMSGISPRRLACSVSGQRAERLVPAIRDVLERAIEAGGSSLRDYAQVDGELGYFQHSWKAYGREGEACGQPGCAGTISRIVQSGRSTFFCGAHQR